MKEFLRKKGVTLSVKDYFITALSYMALGLFSSLIIGTIINTIGVQLHIHSLEEMGNFAMETKIWGGAIGTAIAYGLKAPPLVVFASLFSGAFGAELGGPAGSYVSALLATEIGKIIYKETRLDILLTPFLTIATGFFTAKFIGPPIQTALSWFGEIINWSTEQQPLIMGMIVAVLMGWALTAPISSVAIALMLSLEGLAAGAATVGCAAQMVGFAVASYRDNGLGGLLAQGIGTSMLQVGNIIRKPIILLPPTIAGALLAPFATVVFSLVNNPSGAGMGTAGFVGQIMTFESMGFSWETFWIVLGLHIAGPAAISLVVAELLRKRGWIQAGDMKIDYE